MLVFDEHTLTFAEWRTYTNPRTGKTGYISDGGQVRYDDPRPKEQAKKDARTGAESALAAAVNDPARLHDGHVDALPAAMKTVTRDHLKNVAKQLRLKLGGPKAALADRVLAYVRGHRDAAANAPSVPPAAPPPPAAEPAKPATDPDTGIPAEPKRGAVYNIKTSALEVDPARFQFKTNTDAAGVTKELAGVKVFNPDFAGVISAWKDPDNGKTYVVNGHHRTDLAKRTDHPELPVRYITAPDAKSARAVGALINIAEGRGTAVDAAKFMRDSGVTADDFQKYGVSMNGQLAADANSLTHLNDRIFDRVARGTLEPGEALAIGRNLRDPELQNTLVDILDKRAKDGKPVSATIVAEMAKEMAETPKTTTTTSTLWGDETDTKSVFIERAELKNLVRNELARTLTDFQAVGSTRRAGKVGAAGNVLNVAENQKRAALAEQDKNLFDKLVNRGGHISSAINAAAVEYAAAKTKKEKDRVRKQVVERVRDAIDREYAAIGGRG